MKKPPVSIRPATPTDAEEIGDVLTAAGMAAWASFLGEERVERANRGRTHPADLVGVDEDGIAGFVAWNSATGEIERLYTVPRAWGRGIGRALLERALDALRESGCREAWLYTEQRNERGIGFYEHLGWKRKGDVRVRDWHGARLREPRFVKDL